MAKVDFLSDVEVLVASPKNILSAKLRWYDLGGRTSERQWRDILVRDAKQAELVSRLPRYT